MPWTEGVSDKIGQFAILWMDADELQRSPTRGLGTIYNGFAVEEGSLGSCSRGRNYVSTLYAQCYAFTCGTVNSTKGQFYRFSKKASLLHADMGHAACARIKNHVRQDTFFTVRAKYLAAEM